MMEKAPGVNLETLMGQIRPHEIGMPELQNLYNNLNKTQVGCCCVGRLSGFWGHRHPLQCLFECIQNRSRLPCDASRKLHGPCSFDIYIVIFWSITLTVQ